MPQVGKKKFPYTKKGMAAAKRARKKVSDAMKAADKRMRSMGSKVSGRVVSHVAKRLKKAERRASY